MSAGCEKERDEAEQGEQGGGADWSTPHTVAEIILAVTVLVRLESSVFVGLAGFVVGLLGGAAPGRHPAVHVVFGVAGAVSVDLLADLGVGPARPREAGEAAGGDGVGQAEVRTGQTESC